MKFFIKTIYLIIVGLLIFNSTVSFTRDANAKHTKEEISNYLSGIISLNQNNTKRSFDHLSKMKSLSTFHSNYNINYIRSLVLLEKFEEAFSFANSAWREDELFFEIDLLLGLEAYIKKDYKTAQKYFTRLNKLSNTNFLFQDFFGNILISWIKASENKKNESFEFLNKIPERYSSLRLINESFLSCYFDESKTEIIFKKVIGDKDRSFSRYNYFLVNYLISKNKVDDAKDFINKIAKSHNSTLLIKQTNNYIDQNKIKKISNYFDCNIPRDSIAEIFYVIANMYATQKDYQTSNFYLTISLFLNKKFKPNKILLAENYFFQKKFDKSKKTYKSVKKIGPIYSWFASKSISIIIKKTQNVENSISYLKKEFNSLKRINFYHYYEFANHYKDNEYYDESIKYYSLALEKINKENDLIPKILHRRGICLERTGNWEEAEKDFLESLKLVPDQPYVLNYLAYTWVDKKMNIPEALVMLEEAARLEKNDGYIIDSLGWAHFRNNNYIQAEKFLQKAVELLPLDPIINDHYADVLWMLNKNIQARYFWRHAISLDNIEAEIKDKINQKLIFGINNKS